MRIKKIVRYLAASFITPLVLFLVFDLVFPFKPSVAYSTTVLDRNGDLLNAYLSPDDKWRLYLDTAEISKEFEKAILFKEDQYFYRHFGINPFAIARAAFQNITTGKRTSGASTITMQLARLLNPKARTYGNKLIEMLHSLQLELHYSKEEILRLYLNLLPYGGNIEGLKSASVMYFGKNPDLLSISEIAGLVIIPNRPSSLAIGIHNEAINEAKNIWLKRFQSDSLFESLLLDQAIAEDLNPKRISAPNNAPHLSQRLKRDVKSSVIRTFVNSALQRKVEAITEAHVESIRSMNIQNAAVLVVDNTSKEVISYVGSADFYDTRDAGQVDGVPAIRSPGSTLKPLLYALLFDEGSLTPKTKIADVRTSFEGYRPVNYDNELYGWISVEDALTKSLNIPAVKLLNDYGVSKFITSLAAADFQTIEKTRNSLGLSVILGGCGTSLEELTSLYSAFGTDGRFVPVRLTTNTAVSDTTQVISREANFILTEILTQVTRPSLPDSWRDNPNLPEIAWKTGTSFGRRDAWSIGYNKDFTVGVWVGNFSGEGAPDLSGSVAAAPLLFDVFNLVDSKSPANWYSRPSKVDFKYVCNETGDLPNEFCVNQVVDQSIAGKTLYSKCQHLVPVFISPDSTITYCQTCLNDAKTYQTALYPNHSPEMLDYFESEKIAYAKAPPHYRFCERVYPNQGLEIISPTANAEFYVDKNDIEQMLLKALTPSNADSLYWYINDLFYRSTAVDKPIYFTPPEGRVKISCSDDRGRNQDIMITVKKVGF